MAIIERPGGRFGVRVYDGAGRKRWLGTFDTRDAAIAAEAEGRDRRSRVGTGIARPPWSLETKGEGRCRSCSGRADNLHHIVPASMLPPLISEGQDPAYNGLPLCDSCHKGWHAGRVVIYAACLEPRELVFARAVAGSQWVEAQYPDPDAGDEVVRLRAEVAQLRAALAQIQQITASTTRTPP